MRERNELSPYQNASVANLLYFKDRQVHVALYVTDWSSIA